MPTRSRTSQIAAVATINCTDQTPFGPAQDTWSPNRRTRLAAESRRRFGVFEFQVAGSGNNAVWALNETFETVDLLVNTIGNHTGTRFISLTYDATGLEVDVSGEWTFTISPPTNMFPPATAQDFNVPVVDTTGSFDGAVEGVVDWTGPGIIALRIDDRVVEITASGDGNIALWAYSTMGETELLVNEIDQFQGSVRLPDCSDMCRIDIDGDMTYPLSIRP